MFVSSCDWSCWHYKELYVNLCPSSTRCPSTDCVSECSVRPQSLVSIVTQFLHFRHLSAVEPKIKAISSDTPKLQCVMHAKVVRWQHC